MTAADEDDDVISEGNTAVHQFLIYLAQTTWLLADSEALARSANYCGADEYEAMEIMATYFEQDNEFVSIDFAVEVTEGYGICPLLWPRPGSCRATRHFVFLVFPSLGVLVACARTVSSLWDHWPDGPYFVYVFHAGVRLSFRSLLLVCGRSPLSARLIAD